MKKHLSLLLAVCLPAFASAQSGGPLTPPGAPAPTMKSLDEVEARTAISTVPYVISQPGSYYLTKNLSGGDLTITASDVSLDLNGFNISGATSPLSVLNASRVRVRNGSTTGGKGILLTNVRSSLLENIQCSGGDNGVTLTDCSAVRVSSCGMSDSSFNGISLSSCEASVVERCEVVSAGAVGIRVSTGGGDSRANVVRGCSVTGSGSSGITVGASGGKVGVGNLLENNMVSQSDVYGIRIDAANGNRVSGNIVEGWDWVGESYGIISSGARNLVTGNTCVGEDFHFGVFPGNSYGPIVNPTSGALSTTGAEAHPLANFAIDPTP